MKELSIHHHVHFDIFLTTLFLLFFHRLPLATADIRTLTITDDTRELIEFSSFGFTSTGHVTISVSSVSVKASPIPGTSTTPQTNSSHFGFFVAPVETHIIPNACILDNPGITILSTLSELSPPPQSSVHKTISITNPDEYVFMFANCAIETSVSMIVHFEIYNLDSNGKKDYLSDGKTQLPTLLSIYSLIYIPFLIYWTVICYKNRTFVHKIHILMSILLLMKSLNLIFEAEDKYHVKITGTPRGWEALFFIFRTIRALLLFTVIVLVGTGWSFLKPFLQDNEKRLLMIGIPLQVLVNIAYIMETEQGPSAKNFGFWFTIFVFVDIACCFVIMIPVTWSIRTLRDTSKMDGRAATNLKKLRLFRDFYIALVVYLYFTRYSAIFLTVYLNYKDQWWCPMVTETATLGFYTTMYYLFQPQERNQYFALAFDEEEEEAALTVIQSSEFSDY